jgi:tRNA dimethylallyltransferase
LSAPPLLPVLVGPTGSGKTDLALRAAALSSFPVEVIGLDSRQIYRQLEVGTAKPTQEERARLPHHCVDFLDIDESYDAGRYRARVERTLPRLWERGVVPLVVGGAGFYLRALREGFLELPESGTQLAVLRAAMEAESLEALRERLAILDPPSAARIHPNDRYRISRALEIQELSGEPLSQHEKHFEPRAVCGVEFAIVHLSPPRPLLHERIERRAHAWLNGPWQAEVAALLAAGREATAPGLSVLGYPEVLASLRNELDDAQLLERVVIATRRYARQQETWFRKEVCVERAADGAELVEPLVALLRAARERGAPPP